MPTRADREEWPQIAVQLGQRIRELREARELTQERLAELSGVHRNQIQNIENSRNNARDRTGQRQPGPANPQLDTIWAIAQVLEVRLTDLLPHQLGGPADHEGERKDPTYNAP